MSWKRKRSENVEEEGQREEKKRSTQCGWVLQHDSHLKESEEQTQDEQTQDEQAPDEQAPDEQAPDEQAPDEQAPDEQAHDEEVHDVRNRHCSPRLPSGNADVVLECGTPSDYMDAKQEALQNRNGKMIDFAAERADMVVECEASSQNTDASYGPSTCDGPQFVEFLRTLEMKDLEDLEKLEMKGIRKSVSERYCDACRGPANSVMRGACRLYQATEKLRRVESHQFNDEDVPITEGSKRHALTLEKKCRLKDFFDV